MVKSDPPFETGGAVFHVTKIQNAYQGSGDIPRASPTWRLLLKPLLMQEVLLTGFDSLPLAARGHRL